MMKNRNLKNICSFFFGNRNNNEYFWGQIRKVNVSGRYIYVLKICFITQNSGINIHYSFNNLLS